ncbi:MAG: hypothetical protein ACPGXK_12125, partial [Phycisphaerae bacterium]
INSAQIRAAYAPGNANACAGFSGGDFDAPVVTSAQDGGSVAGPGLTQIMNVGDALIIRWLVTNDCGILCQSEGIIAIDYNQLVATSWQVFNIDGEDFPSQDDACENVDFRIEVKRQ